MVFTDKETKLLRLALDGAATDAEASTAAGLLIHILRRRNVRAEEFTAVATAPRRTVSIETIMPFGKHKGRALSDIPEDYLVWVLDNCNLTPRLRTAILVTLQGVYT